MQNAERQSELAATPRDLVQFGEAHPPDEARSEMQQCEAPLAHQRATERHEALKASATRLQQYFERLHYASVQPLEEHLDEHFKVAAGRMMEECHAELLKAETHVGTEYISCWHGVLPAGFSPRGLGE